MIVVATPRFIFLSNTVMMFWVWVVFVGFLFVFWRAPDLVDRGWCMWARPSHGKVKGASVGCCGECSRASPSGERLLVLSSGPRPPSLSAVALCGNPCFWFWFSHAQCLQKVVIVLFALVVKGNTKHTTVPKGTMRVCLVRKPRYSCVLHLFSYVFV